MKMFFSKILVHGLAVGAALQMDVPQKPVSPLAAAVALQMDIPQQPVSPQLKAVVIGGEGVRISSMMIDMKPKPREDHRQHGYTSNLFRGSKEFGDLMVYEVHSPARMSSGPLADALQTANVIVFVCDIKKPASFKEVVELKNSLSRSTSSSHDPDFMLVMTGTPEERSWSYTSLFDVKPVQMLLSKNERHRQFSFRLASSPAITDEDIESVPNHAHMSAKQAYEHFFKVISKAAARHGFIAPKFERFHFIRTPEKTNFISRAAEENYIRNPQMVQAPASSVPASQPSKQPEPAEESRRQMQPSEAELERMFENLKIHEMFIQGSTEMFEANRDKELAHQETLKKIKEDSAQRYRNLEAQAAAHRRNVYSGWGACLFVILIAILMHFEVLRL